MRTRRCSETGGWWKEAVFCEDNNEYEEIYISEKRDPPLHADWAHDDADIDLDLDVRLPPAIAPSSRRTHP
jgi:hypothetical protein